MDEPQKEKERKARVVKRVAILRDKYMQTYLAPTEETLRRWTAKINAQLDAEDQPMLPLIFDDEVEKEEAHAMSD